MKTCRWQLPATAALTIAFVSVTAQVPDTLRVSLTDPGNSPQAATFQGRSVAVDGGLAVVSAPLDDFGGENSGVVKVYDTSTGKLLHILANPGPGTGEEFGHSVAVSGTRVVVGLANDTGAQHAGTAYVFELAGATPGVPVAVLTNPTPELSDYFGKSVAISGSLVVVGAEEDDTGGSNAGSAYVYDVAGPTPATPLAILTNPGELPDRSRFGVSVAVSGTLAVIGALNRAVSGGGASSAYVYDLARATPTVPVLTLENPGQDPGYGDRFGEAVSISGTIVVVGASGDDRSGPDAGSVYVYDTAGATPAMPIATLNYPHVAWRCSTSVAVSGTRVVAGATQCEIQTPNEGRVHVYDLSSPTPAVPVAILNNPSPEPDDWFGYSVAVSGSRVVVGEPSDDAGAGNAGSAWVFDLTSETPTVPVTRLDYPGMAHWDFFGTSVAVRGPRLVIGANRDDTGASDAGIVYVYDLAGPTPTTATLKLQKPNPAPGDYFGSPLALSGSRVAVGAALDDTGAEDSGGAWVYDLAGATPTVPVVALANPGPARDDGFGGSVAMSGTLLAVGASRDDTIATDAGSVYVYDLAGAMPAVPVLTLNKPNPVIGDFFGYGLAVSGTRIVVGATRDDTGAPNAGSVYIYDMGGAMPGVPVAVLNNPSPAADEFFGGRLSISGSLVVVGDPSDGTVSPHAGSAYVYDLAGATPAVPVITLRNPNPALAQSFGLAVDLSGERIVVGAPGYSPAAPYVGVAYVYDLDGATPTVPAATLKNPTPAINELFGNVVAIDDTTIVVGTPSEDGPTVNQGAVYVFTPGPPVDADHDGLRDAWELTYWPETADHGALDDFDHDGYVELLELAFGLDPTLPDSGGMDSTVPNPGGRPPVRNESGYMTMTIAKRAGVTYEVQTAGTLLPGLTNSFSAASTTLLFDDDSTLKVRDNVRMGTPPGRYMRVRVTAAP